MATSRKGDRVQQTNACLLYDSNISSRDRICLEDVFDTLSEHKLPIKVRQIFEQMNTKTFLRQQQIDTRSNNNTYN